MGTSVHVDGGCFCGCGWGQGRMETCQGNSPVPPWTWLAWVVVKGLAGRTWRTADRDRGWDFMRTSGKGGWETGVSRLRGQPGRSVSTMKGSQRRGSLQPPCRRWAAGVVMALAWRRWRKAEREGRGDMGVMEIRRMKKRRLTGRHVLGSPGLAHQQAKAWPGIGRHHLPQTTAFCAWPEAEGAMPKTPPTRPGVTREFPSVLGAGV